MAADLPALQRQPGANPEAIALAFSRLSRSSRLTDTLENRIVVDLVGDQLKGEGSGDDDDRFLALGREAHERLTDIEDDDGILGQSAAEIVEEICGALRVVIDPALFEADDLIAPHPTSDHPGDPEGDHREERSQKNEPAFNSLESGPQRPSNTGSRFSTKALAASLWSAVWPQWTW